LILRGGPYANKDLQPIAVMLQLVRPAGAARRLLGDNWLTGMNEAPDAQTIEVLTFGGKNETKCRSDNSLRVNSS